ncbi:hypothetical protein [uncultured Vagococcus sp.]|uniref:hypothetical protein n=1 Tax=uncultured Vagococcus sp. TaxID=189676 RepID=UPI0028D32D9C|nr:hypothetical protein [uncultured Vagococcus sp.]
MIEMQRLRDIATRDEGRYEGKEEGKEEGLVKGREEGRAEGLVEGREEGKTEEQERIAINLLKLGMSLEQVKKLTNLRLPRLLELSREIKN